LRLGICYIHTHTLTSTHPSSSPPIVIVSINEIHPERLIGFLPKTVTSPKHSGPTALDHAKNFSRLKPHAVDDQQAKISVADLRKHFERGPAPASSVKKTPRTLPKFASPAPRSATHRRGSMSASASMAAGRPDGEPDPSPSGPSPVAALARRFDALRGSSPVPPDPTRLPPSGKKEKAAASR